jgi:hypothetical protein
MGFFTHLFYPWGFIVQIAALVHFFRRRADMFWLWIILIGGFVGAAAYILIEVLPDAALIRQVFQSHGRKTRIAVVEAALVDNPSVANLEELGELYWDEKNYAKAWDAFSRAIATHADAARTFYRAGVCALMLGDPSAAIPDLEYALRTEPKLDFYRPGMFLAQAYAAVGRNAEAEEVFATAMQFTSTPEMLYSYAAFLKSQNRKEEAREWALRLAEKKRTAPRFVQRVERPWFNKGKALLKELSAP